MGNGAERFLSFQGSPEARPIFEAQSFGSFALPKPSNWGKTCREISARTVLGGKAMQAMRR
jgi:hypothetical protein